MDAASAAHSCRGYATVLFMQDGMMARGLLDLAWHSPVEMLIGLIASGVGRHPPQVLGYAPDMGVHGELMGAQAEHEHACYGLGAHTLEPALCIQF